MKNEPEKCCLCGESRWGTLVRVGDRTLCMKCHRTEYAKKRATKKTPRRTKR